MANVFDIGQSVQCRATIVASGAPVDPDKVVFKFSGPSGVATTCTYGVDSAVQRVATGAYLLNIDADAEGRWQTRVVATGTFQGAWDDGFDVTGSTLA